MLRPLTFNFISMLLAMDLNEINDLSVERFIQVFGNVIERHEPFAEFLSKPRPFSGVECLFRVLGAYLQSLDESDILEILGKHPDLSGRINTNLTSDSKFEQKSSGLWEMSLEQADRLSCLNQMYRDKFQFPFIVCVKENSFDAIWKNLRMRLEKSRDEETMEAFYQVKLIATHRIKALVKME